jgi:hypothetical protein
MRFYGPKGAVGAETPAAFPIRSSIHSKATSRVSSQGRKTGPLANNEDAQQRSKRAFAIHGSGAEFPDRVFMLDEPAFGLLVRIPAKISI